MLKKEIKGIFKAIRDSNTLLVKELIDKNSNLLFARNFAPPKKDDGQSPLQVALKTGNLEIAAYLIAKGADVNFIEDPSINQ